MSSNFLNTSGHFAGIDNHLYLMLGVPPAVPIPMPCVTHVVGQLHEVGNPFQKAETVTTQGLSSLQNGWAMMLVPHVPIPPGPPHITELIYIAAIILASQSAPKLAASTVHGEGQPLLVEALSAYGLNCDCSDNWVGFGADVNFNTVKTTPTLKDYAMAIAGAAFNSVKNQVMGARSNKKADEMFGGVDTLSAAVKQQLKASAQKVGIGVPLNFAVPEALDFVG